jgi:hypothetical protein
VLGELDQLTIPHWDEFYERTPDGFYERTTDEFYERTPDRLRLHLQR